MRFPPPFVGLAYFIVGVFFAFNSSPRGMMETHWGSVLIAITCLILGARFFGLPLKHDALMGKAVKSDPLE